MFSGEYFSGRKVWGPRRSGQTGDRALAANPQRQGACGFSATIPGPLSTFPDQVFGVIFKQMERKRKNANFINGVPELLVLKLLSADRLYGYQLVKEIQQLNPAAFDFGEGCIYPILHSLEKDGLLQSESVAVNGRTRLYYATTPAGKARLDELSREWLSTMAGVGRLFGEAIGGLGDTMANLADLLNPTTTAKAKPFDEAEPARQRQAQASATGEF